MIRKNSITKKNLFYNFIFRASLDKKIRTYYHLLEPLFHAMSDNNMYLNLGYMDLNNSSENFSVVFNFFLILVLRVDKYSGSFNIELAKAFVFLLPNCWNQ